MTRPPRFEYPDEHGFTLSVTPGPGTLGDVSSVRIGGGPECRVLAEHRSKVAEGLWTGAGLPAPVILERPELDPEGAKGIDGFRVLLDGGEVHVGYGSHATAGLGFGPARLLASVIAAYADLGEAGPDPDKVEELALVLRSRTPGMAYPHEGDYGLAVAREYARAALTWMKQRGEVRDA